MGVRIQVPNTEIHYFQDTSKLTATTAAGDSHPITKIIRHGAATPNTTGAELWLDVQCHQSVGAITVKYESSRDAITIPWSSIATDDDRSWVGLLGDDQRIERRAIALGETSGTSVEVLDGLREGDVLLRYQPRSHREGSQVDPVPPGEKSRSDP
jgi:multidrug efflux pump subunit AcrA (membrane-fusion protein)